MAFLHKTWLVSFSYGFFLFNTLENQGFLWCQEPHPRQLGAVERQIASVASGVAGTALQARHISLALAFQNSTEYTCYSANDLFYTILTIFPYFSMCFPNFLNICHVFHCNPILETPQAVPSSPASESSEQRLGNRDSKPWSSLANKKVCQTPLFFLWCFMNVYIWRNWKKKFGGSNNHGLNVMFIVNVYIWRLTYEKTFKKDGGFVVHFKTSLLFSIRFRMRSKIDM